MNLSSFGVEIIFVATLAITFTAAFLGRKHSQKNSSGLTKQNLNKWLIGLSAGATANSGFIVTGAVGLGYTFGFQWLFLPISWFLGDLVFWKFCPNRINALGQKTGITTLSELLKVGLSGRYAKIASILAAILIVVCLGGYTSAQWIAGQKFVSGAFDVSPITSLMFFACVIVAYTSIGGFRGSIYADSVQAIIRIIGTFLALIAVIYFALEDQSSFITNWESAGDDFLSWLPGNTIGSAIFFVLGYAFAAIGFGLGQPQLVSRYLAGSSPEETKSAQWIYISFVQLTWISMTLFGVILRGVMPDISDPEAGLSVFFRSYFGNILTGIIVADIFSTIAATSNSLLVAMSQAIVHDFFPSHFSNRHKSKLSIIVVLLLGLFTMILALFLSKDNTVFTIALSSISLLASGLAAPVLIKIFGLPSTGFSLLMSISLGLISSIVWKVTEMDLVLNETVIGIVVGFSANWLVVNLARKRLEQVNDNG